MKRALVAYFSASGVTENLAKRLAKCICADIFEIEPKVAYTKEDLDWTNQNSRSSVEMKDRDYRPEIKNSLNADDYDVIFVGFPIWWYVAPTIINTFLESLNLAGKTVVPFATSGSSKMGRTAEFLRPSAKGATVKEGKRFSSSCTDKELEDFAKEQCE